MLNLILLLGVGIVYIIVGLNYFIQGNSGMGIAFVAYAVANIGLYMAGRT